MNNIHKIKRTANIEEVKHFISSVQKTINELSDILENNSDMRNRSISLEQIYDIFTMEIELQKSIQLLDDPIDITILDTSIQNLTKMKRDLGID